MLKEILIELQKKEEGKLSLKEKILLEKIKNDPERVLLDFYMGKLKLVKQKIEPLNKKVLYGKATNEEKELLEKLETMRKKLLTKIKEINSKKVKLDIEDFGESDIIPSFGEILDYNKNNNDIVKLGEAISKVDPKFGKIVKDLGKILYD